jgi:predicted transcriptional regulator of viral defense system
MTAGTVALLGAIAEQRWGLVTTSQAELAGVSRMKLSRLAAAGAVTRVLQGVYRMAGAPMLEHEDIIATWLATGGDSAAPTTTGAPGLVVAGIDAAILHGIGDFYPEGHTLISPTRKGTRLPGVKIKIRTLAPEEVTYVEALPTLTIERTIADLVESWTDRSLISDTIRDAITQGRLVHPQRLVEHLAPLAAANGHGLNDGAALAQELFELAGTNPSGWAPRV